MIRSNETTEQRRHRIDKQWLAAKRKEAAKVYTAGGFHMTAHCILGGLYDCCIPGVTSH